MAKVESTLKNMVVVLFLVTAVSATVLGFVYQATKAPIEKAKLNKKLNAIKEVVPAFDNDPSKEVKIVEVGGEKMEFYPAKKGDKLVGTAVKTFTNNGFSGKMWFMVGFLPDGTIHNFSVLEQLETPGLGTKMDPWFKVKKENKKNSILGLNPSKVNFTVSKDGGDVDAITAATITSRAFLEAVKRGYDEYLKLGGTK